MYRWQDTEWHNAPYALWKLESVYRDRHKWIHVCFRGLPFCVSITPVGWLPELTDTCKTDILFRVSTQLNFLINLFIRVFVSLCFCLFLRFTVNRHFIPYHNCFLTFFFHHFILISILVFLSKSCFSFLLFSQIPSTSTYLFIFYYTINYFFLHFLLSYCHSFFQILLFVSARSLSFFAALFFILLFLSPFYTSNDAVIIFLFCLLFLILPLICIYFF
jgi:Predicted membrane-associated HD superfamily hydrolase